MSVAERGSERPILVKWFSLGSSYCFSWRAHTHTYTDFSTEEKERHLLVLEDKAGKSNLWVFTKNCRLIFSLCCDTLVSHSSNIPIHERWNWAVQLRCKELQLLHCSRRNTCGHRKLYRIIHLQCLQQSILGSGCKVKETYQEMLLKRQRIKSASSTK